MNKTVKALAAIILAAAMCCTLGGCSFFDVFSVDSIIRAPKITGENSEIQQCFEASVGADVSLISPVAGEFRSSFVFYDFDKDSVDEVIVFYTENNIPGVARMHFLDYTNNKWRSVADVKGNGSGVYSIEFSNMDSFQAYELAVSWTVSDSKRVKTLSLYKYNLNSVSGDISFLSLATIQVSDYILIDMDFDSSNELFYTYINSTESTPGVTAKLLKLDSDKDELYPVSEVSLDSGITAFIGYKFDIKNGNYRIYIDCEQGAGTYRTEIICFDYSKSALVSATDDEGNLLSGQTIRYYPLQTVDLNSNSALVIPRQYVYEGSYIYNAPEGETDKVYITEYLKLEDKEFSSAAKYYIVNDSLYRIKVDTLFESMYLIYDYLTGVVQFRVKDLPESENLAFSLQYQENSDSEAANFIVNISSLGESLNFNTEVITNLIELL